MWKKLCGVQTCGVACFGHGPSCPWGQGIKANRLEIELRERQKNILLFWRANRNVTRPCDSTLVKKNDTCDVFFGGSIPRLDGDKSHSSLPSYDRTSHSLLWADSGNSWLVLSLLWKWLVAFVTICTWDALNKKKASRVVYFSFNSFVLSHGLWRFYSPSVTKNGYFSPANQGGNVLFFLGF